MAIKKVVEIGANVKQAVSEIKDLYNELLEAEKEASRLNEELEKTGEDGSKALNNVSRASDESSSSFEGMGTAIKGIGIGALVALVGSLTSILSKNQRVVDFSRTAFIALEIAVNKTITAISKATDNFKKFIKEGNQSKITIKQLADELTKNFIFRINKATESIYYMGKAFKDLFTDGLVKASESAKKSLTSVADAISGVEDFAKKVKDTVEEIVTEAGNLVDLQNKAKIAQAELRRSVEYWDSMAEKQRQIRDNENLTIKQRQKANDLLGKYLENQYSAQTALAKVGVRVAELEYQINNSIENRVALIDAETEVLATQAQIEGFRSEQLVNQQSLERELLELSQTRQEQEAKTALFNEKVNKQYETDSIKRLENAKELLEKELDLESERLEAKIKMYQEGTQAYQDAENELVAFREEKELEIAEKEREILKTKEEREREVLQNVVGDETLIYEERLKALDAFDRAVINATQLSEYEKTKILNENAKARKAIDDLEKDNKLKSLKEIANAGMEFAKLLGEQTTIGKTMAVASTLIDTYASAMSSYKGMVASIPGPWGIASGVAAAASSVAMGLNNVKEILSVKVPYGGSSAGGSSGGTPQAPNFNIVGQSSTNQLAETIGQQEQEPIQAYVVATEMTTKQALQRNITETASFG